jgi:predicted permease
MGIRLIEGRDFEPRDFKEDETGTAPGVVIVNRRFAEHFFKGRSAIGRHVGYRKERLNREIVGVVEDSLYEGPREGVRRQVFVPKTGNGGTAVYVRGAIGSAQLYPALRGAVRKLDASMPVYDMKTLSAQLDETLLTERLIALLSAGFGLLATLLAAIGLYGVMAFVVTRRTREIGIRMALGAPTGSVLWMVMREVALLAAIGLALGIPAALALGRYVSAQLYGIKGQDPWMAGVATIVLVIVAACAGLIPARRASRIDPILALRYE